MARFKSFLPFVLLIGCSEHGKTPDPWGVPITGGTITVTRDGTRAIVSDPDRDRVLAVDLTSGAVSGEVALDPGDEPGRVIEDGAGRIHVALRHGGALVTLDAAVQQITARRFVCNEPRGLAWDAAADTVHVACAGGELVSFAAAGGDAPVRSLRLDRDLRDVIVSGTQLIVTRFRTAEVLTLDAQGAVVSRVSPPTVQRSGGGFFPDAGGEGVPTPTMDGTSTGDGAPAPGGIVNAAPSTAWRTIALPDGRLVVSHQRKVKDSLDTQQEGGYGGNCGGGPVEDAISVIAPGQAPQALARIGHGALPVDIAASTTGDKLAVVVAGSKTVTVVTASAALAAPDQEDCQPPPPPCDGDTGSGAIGTGPDNDGRGDCEPPKCEDPDADGNCPDDGEDRRLGTPTSVAFTPSGDLVIFYPEAPALIVRTAGGPESHRIDLTGGHGLDAGRNVFHAQTRIGLACASCHPEARDDGQTWNFAQFGARRTQSLAGHILERAPYHWTGDMTNLTVLMDDVFAHRMSGGVATEAQKRALGPWLDRIPAPSGGAVVDSSAVERGKALFDSADTACASCHNGDLYSNKLLVNVGTGGNFKVPSLLGIAARAPFMHDGCAATLLDRFSCGGGDLHGHTSQLTAPELADLVAYLESL
ncbi:MAG: cytochrome peroxidase [Deltaproteobacteria bacterium]|nr:cytochrome peroxidase [Deltaproteobacteria bacterium]